MVQRLRHYLVGISMVVLGMLTPIAVPVAVGAMPANAKTAAERVQGKLDAVHKKVCEARATTIKNIMQKVATQGEKNIDTFSKIATKVEQFYTNKKLTVSNYDTLVAAVTTKHDAAVAAANTVKAGVTFDCNGSSPVGAVDQFKTEMQAMRQAIKDYRTAINNLLVAVKQAAQATKTGSAQ